MFRGKYLALALLAALAGWTQGAVAAEQQTTLADLGKSLKIDADKVSVSGISSGGFMPFSTISSGVPARRGLNTTAVLRSPAIARARQHGCKLALDQLFGMNGPSILRVLNSRVS